MRLESKESVVKKNERKRKGHTWNTEPSLRAQRCIPWHTFILVEGQCGFIPVKSQCEVEKEEGRVGVARRMLS
jgi:hypothetical protein